MNRFLAALAVLTFAAFALANDCCSDKAAKVEAKECSACESGSAAKSRSKTMVWDEELRARDAEERESAFWATAAAMWETSEARPAPMIALTPRPRLASKSVGSCDKSTPSNPIAKGGEGCCNAAGSPAKFKVWNGFGYEFFGCADSAAEGRSELIRLGYRTGAVQAVVAGSARVN